jgi:myosin heavy subunit
VDDAKDYEELKEALGVLGFTEDEQDVVCEY